MTEPTVHWLDTAKRQYDDKHAAARDAVQRRLFGDPKDKPATDDTDDGPEAA